MEREREEKGLQFSQLERFFFLSFFLISLSFGQTTFLSLAFVLSPDLFLLPLLFLHHLCHFFFTFSLTLFLCKLL